VSRTCFARLAALLLLSLSCTALTPSAGAASTPACRTGGLVIWLSESAGGGAAGSFYYTLELTNLSGRSCTLYGYPGVSAVNLAGGQIGASARRESGQSTARVTLAQGASATAVLRITDTGDYSAGQCRPTLAAGLRVYPPGQSSSRVVPFPFQACASSAVKTLSVRALRAS
jgi:hypothetical protein